MNKEIWRPDLIGSSPIFESIPSCTENFLTKKNWPTLEQLNQKFIESNISIRAIAQQAKPEKFDQRYESKIYLSGELQTRTENWHDFFNAMIWIDFPDIKKILNKLHYQASQTRSPGSNRSVLENTITLFDECGMIIISDDEHLLELIKTHRWKELFFDYKKEFNQHIKCITFGHAMLEKALKPYIGMTAHAILIHSDQLLNENLTGINKAVANMWERREINTTADLQPIPILGIPGWYHNQNIEFYSNKNYFRPKNQI